MGFRVDVHQHLLGEPLRAALAARVEPPHLRLRAGGWWLEVAGEPAYPLDAAAEDVDARAALVEADGLDLALIALSNALGIEALPADEAAELIAAYERGLDDLPNRFAGWGAVPLREPDPTDVDALLDRGRIGLTLPASAIASATGLDRVGPLLERLERRGAPLFVHPGPLPPQSHDVAGWWPALTGYVSEMNAAWHAFIDVGRPAHPNLRVVFALLAGAAPLHVERLAARGGPAERAIDSGLHYDVSSYGPRAVEAVGRIVGVRQLVYGSDRPMVEPASPAESVWAVAAAENGARIADPLAAAGASPPRTAAPPTPLLRAEAAA